MNQSTVQNSDKIREDFYKTQLPLLKINETIDDPFVGNSYYGISYTKLSKEEVQERCNGLGENSKIYDFNCEVCKERYYPIKRYFGDSRGEFIAIWLCKNCNLLLTETTISHE